MAAILPRATTTTLRSAAERQMSHRGLIISIALALLVIVVGTLGYHFIVGASFFEALYFTIITLSTIGYRELAGFSDAGRAFTIILVILGLVVFSYTVSKVTQFLVEGAVIDILGVRKMQRQIDSLENHFILCGYGRLAPIVTDHLLHHKRPFVVIDLDEEVVNDLLSKDIPAIRGDATEEDVLLEAGLERARTVLVLTPSDPANVFITMTARTLNKDVDIISRATDPGTRKKLEIAGANRIVLPFERGAVHMAQAALRPSVVDFLDVTSTRGGEGIRLEEFLVPDDSLAEGKTLAELNLSQRYNLIVVAIKHQRGEAPLEFNPRAESRVEGGDRLIILGREDAVMKFEKELKK